MFKTVLFPIDHSQESTEAAAKVIEIINTFQARLVLLSVVELGQEAPNPHFPNMSSAQIVAQLLNAAKAMFSQAGIEAEAIEREGNPAFIICDVADEIEADLIVMGCRGTGLTGEGAIDSVSNRVINLSPCPILVVP